MNRTLAILRYSYIMSFGAIKRLVDSGLLQLSVLQAIHSSYVEESSRVERGQEVRACSGAKKMYFITHYTLSYSLVKYLILLLPCPELQRRYLNSTSP